MVTVSAEAGIFNMYMQCQGNNTFWKWLVFNAIYGIFCKIICGGLILGLLNLFMLINT